MAKYSSGQQLKVRATESSENSEKARQVKQI